MSKIDDVVDEAQEAFWAVIARQYPQCTSGDITPADTMLLIRAMTPVVKRWVEYNTPPAEKTVEILLHDIEYTYDDDRTISDSAAEHIAYCITIGIREGQLCEEDNDGFTESVFGWWNIPA